MGGGKRERERVIRGITNDELQYYYYEVGGRLYKCDDLNDIMFVCVYDFLKTIAKQNGSLKSDNDAYLVLVFLFILS